MSLQAYDRFHDLHWSLFKPIFSLLQVTYVEDDESYYLAGARGSVVTYCVIAKRDPRCPHQADFEDNYKSLCNV